MSSDFENFMAGAHTPVATPVTKEDFSLAHGHIVKWGVLEILPLKAEIESLGEIDATKDVRRLVPWRAGIIMRVLALRSKDHHGIIRDMFTIDPNGRVTLPFGPKYMTQWVKVDVGEVERGWSRQYNNEGRKLIYDFPPNWEQMQPLERYSYWLTMLGGRFGFQPGALQVGSVFYAYFTRSKSKKDDRWYSDVKKIYKDREDVWRDECPFVFETMDMGTLRALFAKIDEEFSSSDYNSGAPVPAGDTYGMDANPGF